MDSSEFNKIAGAGLAALLAFLLLNFFSGLVYGTHEVGEGHGEEVLAYALAVETEGGGETSEEPQVDLAALVATADPGAGESTFRACGACHKVEKGVNAVGPSLWDVVGRKIASLDGFQYSDALMAKEGDWTVEHMFHFLENPKAWAPGTKMSFAGLKDPQDRVNVIAYLNQAGDAPIDLSAGLEPMAVATADAGTAIPDPALAPGVGPEPGVNPPGEAVEAAPASGESAGIESMSEAAEVEETAPAVVRDSVATAERADAAASPATEAQGQSQEGEAATGEGILHSSDPTQQAPAQQRPGMAGEPGKGTQPMAGQPEAGTPEQAVEAPEPVPPEKRIAGEDAPPQEPPGQAAEPGAAGSQVGEQQAAQPQGAESQGAESQAAAPKAAEAPAAEPQGEQMAAAEAPAGNAGAAGAAAGAAGGVDFSGGDAAAGEKLFRRCGACHKVEEGKNAIGPSLWGVVGRDVASVESYSYSDAMKAHGGVWTPARLFEYLENPKAAVPGTKMAFAGLKKPQDRIDVITYLNEADGSPEPLK